jgi:hypothetical protein
MKAMKKAPTKLASKTGQASYGARYNFFRCIQRPCFAVGWRIERACARIETKHELDKWNRSQ